MEIVTKIAPICLALIMLGLGLGLSLKDFTRILRVPRDFFVGFFWYLWIPFKVTNATTKIFNNSLKHYF